MSLPNQGESWPPADFKDALEQVGRDAQWLTASPGAHTLPGYQPVKSRFQYNGGITGAVARATLGRPEEYRPGTAHTRRHLPFATAMSLVSADLLMSTPPSFELAAGDEPALDASGLQVGGNIPASEFLHSYTSGDRFAAELHQAARQASALGWEYGRVVWDEEVSSHPWIEWVDADMAYAEYRHGRLHAVTFWDEYEHENYIWRLFQEHVAGRVNYAVYRGDNGSVGRRMALADLPQAEYLMDLVDEEGGIETGIQDLTAVHIPNRDRNPQWRKRSHLRYYGLSDINLAGGLWEDFDKVWTDLIHEVDSGRAKLLVTEDFLRSGPPGTGQFFEWFRDVFPLRRGGVAEEPGKIEQVQFDIRVEKYQAMLGLILQEVLQALGISEITVGLSPSGQMTATEIRSRSSRTLATWGAKARMWRAGLSSIMTALVNMDAYLNGYPGLTGPVEVGMVEPVQDTDRDRAERAQLLRSARAASTVYLVGDLHPEWTDEQVAREVALIQAEENLGQASDPFMTGFDVDPKE